MLIYKLFYGTQPPAMLYSRSLSRYSDTLWSSEQILNLVFSLPKKYIFESIKLLYKSSTSLCHTLSNSGTGRVSPNGYFYVMYRSAHRTYSAKCRTCYSSTPDLSLLLLIVSFREYLSSLYYSLK